MALAGIGLELAIFVGLFTGLGYLADGWLGIEPWLTIVGLFVGFVLGIYRLFLQLQRINQN